MAKEIKQQVANTDKSGQQTQLRTSDSPTQGPDCQEGCCFIPRESHTRAGLPSRMLIHTQRVSQRAGLLSRMLFHTQRVSQRAGLLSRMLFHTQRVSQRARLPSRMLFHTQLSEPAYVSGLPSSLPTVTRSTLQLYCVSVNKLFIKMLSFKSTLKDTTLTLLVNLVNF